MASPQKRPTRDEFPKGRRGTDAYNEALKAYNKAITDAGDADRTRAAAEAERAKAESARAAAEADERRSRSQTEAAESARATEARQKADAEVERKRQQRVEYEDSPLGQALGVGKYAAFPAGSAVGYYAGGKVRQAQEALSNAQNARLSRLAAALGQGEASQSSARTGASKTGIAPADRPIRSAGLRLLPYAGIAGIGAYKGAEMLGQSGDPRNTPVEADSAQMFGNLLLGSAAGSGSRGVVSAAIPTKPADPVAVAKIYGDLEGSPARPLNPGATPAAPAEPPPRPSPSGVAPDAVKAFEERAAAEEARRAAARAPLAEALATKSQAPIEPGKSLVPISTEKEPSKTPHHKKVADAVRAAGLTDAKNKALNLKNLETALASNSLSKEQAASVREALNAKPGQTNKSLLSKVAPRGSSSVIGPLIISTAGAIGADAALNAARASDGSEPSTGSKIAAGTAGAAAGGSVAAGALKGMEKIAGALAAASPMAARAIPGVGMALLGADAASSLEAVADGNRDAYEKKVLRGEIDERGWQRPGIEERMAYAPPEQQAAFERAQKEERFRKLVQAMQMAKNNQPTWDVPAPQQYDTPNGFSSMGY